MPPVLMLRILFSVSMFMLVAACTTGPDDLAAPMAPTGLSAAAVSADRIDLSWSDNSSDETGFTIEGCTGAGCGAFSQVAIVGSGATAHSLSSLIAGTTYRYRVRASGVSPSAPSNIAEATTLPLAPAAPTGVAASAAFGNQVTLTWQDNSGDETGFLIQHCTGLGCGGFAALVTVGPNVVSYQDVSADVGVVYRYRVAAVNLGGTSAYSAPVEAVIQPPPPLAPSNLIATVSTVAATITLEWTDNSTSETQFLIERCQGVGCVNFASVGVVGTNVAPSLTRISSQGPPTVTAWRQRMVGVPQGSRTWRKRRRCRRS